LIEHIWWGLDGALIETRTKSHSTIEPAPLGIEPNQTNRPEPDTLMGLPAKVMPHSTLGDRPHHPTKIYGILDHETTLSRINTRHFFGIFYGIC
jgi:hypothetical protein